MKKLFLLSVFMTVVLVSCSSTNSGSYFGYNNNPDQNNTQQVEEKFIPNTGNSNAGWVNPMGNNNNAVNQQTDGFVYSDYSYRYNPQVYVPVIVPWWNQYYGWVSYPFPGSHLTLYYSNCWGYDWYSPWYVYHPWHGSYWGHSYAYGHQHWYHQPVYSRSDRPVQKNSYRSFGANRGSYSYTSSGRNVGSSSERSRNGLSGSTSGRVETSSSRVRDNGSGNIFRTSANSPASDNTSSTRSTSTSSIRNENKAFKPYENSNSSSSVRTSESNSRTNGNVFRTSDNNSGRSYSSPSNSGSSSSSRSSSSGYERSSPSSSSSGNSSGSSSSSSGGSSSSGSSSSGRGSSGGSSSGRTR